MEMSWSTFVLELINFLVLVWILKRFLYKPVLDVIARRREAIEKRLADAETLHADADKLREQYEGRLAEWDCERQQARESLAREIEAERSRRLAELRATLEQEQQKAHVVEARREADARHTLEAAALTQGARFASRLLEQAAGPDVETRLVEMVIDAIDHLPAERVASLRINHQNAPMNIVVSSAYPLDDDRRRRLEATLHRQIAPEAAVRYEQHKDLLAGIQIAIGAWMLGANLRDELKGFADLNNHE